MTKKWCWLAGLSALLNVLALSTAAEARIISEPHTLQSKVQDADSVYQIRVSAVQEETFIDGQTARLCGTNYSVEILERFKGRDRRDLVFAAYSTPLVAEYEKVEAGMELLVLVSEVPRESDPYARVVPDVVLTPPSAAHRACLRRLSPIRLVSEREAAFLLYQPSTGNSESRQVWMVFALSATSMPKDPALDLKPLSESVPKYDDIDVRPPYWLVAWEPMRQWIRSWSCDR